MRDLISALTNLGYDETAARQAATSALNTALDQMGEGKAPPLTP